MNANTPIVNPTMTESSLVLEQQASWAAAKSNVSAYIQNGQAVVKNRLARPSGCRSRQPPGSSQGTVDRVG